LAGAVFLVLLPFLGFLLAPLASIPGKAGWPALRFLARMALSLPALAVPGWCAGAALARLTESGSTPRLWRMAALDSAILCAGASLGAVLSGFPLLPWRGDAWVSFAGAFALFAAAVFSGLPRSWASARPGEEPGSFAPLNSRGLI